MKEIYRDKLDDLPDEIKCDVLQGDPKYYPLSTGSLVKFKEDVKLNGKETEIKNKIDAGEYKDLTISKRYVLSGEEDQGADKVDLTYTHTLPQLTLDGKPTTETLKGVMLTKLEPEEKKPEHFKRGLDQRGRLLYKNEPHAFSDKLTLTDNEYYVLMFLLQEFVWELQRLGIKTKGWDLRQRQPKTEEGRTKALEFKKKNKEYLEQLQLSATTVSDSSQLKDINNEIARIHRMQDVWWIPPQLAGDSVEGIYHTLQNKIFTEATTEQVKRTIPYLIELTKKLNDQKSITTTKIKDFIENLDFEGDLEEQFKTLSKSVADQYQEYWKFDTLYFVDASDRQTSGSGTGFIGGEYFDDDDKLRKISTNDLIDESILNLMGVVNNYPRNNSKENLTTSGEKYDTRLNAMALTLINAYGNVDNYTEKFDIKCVKPIFMDDGTPLMSDGDYLDVKNISTSDSYLGELSTPFKSSAFRKLKIPGTEIPREDHELYRSIYNDLMDTLLKVLVDEGMGDEIISNIIGGTKPFRGLIIKNNIYVPIENIELYWSNKGMMNDHRLTIRYNITGENYKIEFNPNVCEGECNEQTYTITPITVNPTDYKHHESNIFTYAVADIENINENQGDEKDQYISEVLGF